MVGIILENVNIKEFLICHILWNRNIYDEENCQLFSYKVHFRFP